MKVLGHYKIVKFIQPVVPALLNLVFNIFIDTLAFKPHHKTRNVILLGEADRF